MVRATRRFIRDLYNRLPPSRRVKGLGGLDGRGRLVLRTVLAPLLPINIKLTDDRGVSYLVTTDPVDAHIVDDLTGPRRAMWFPDWLDSSNVDLVLDVGGHHGHFIVAACEHWPGCKIVTVEPSRQAISVIEKQARLNNIGDRLQIVDAAIDDKTGEGVLHHDPAGSWGSSLHELGGTVSENVRLVPISDVLSGHHPDVVKCNAEGGEFALIPQLLTLGVRPRLLVVMLHPEFGDADGLVASLRSADFEVESVGSDHRPAIHAWPSGSRT